MKNSKDRALYNKPVTFDLDAYLRSNKVKGRGFRYYWYLRKFNKILESLNKTGNYGALIDGASFEDKMLKRETTNKN